MGGCKLQVGGWMLEVGLKFRKERYSSYDSGKGAEYEAGQLTFENLREIAAQAGEPKQISGKQEMLEQLINSYI